MRNLRGGLVVLAALAVSLFGFVHDAAAQAAFYPKQVQLQFKRLNAASDNPNGALAVAQPYLTQLANGNHNAANLGVALAQQDTTDAIPVWDHWLRSVPAYRTMPVLATALLADSSWFGTLALSANSATIDTVTIYRDWSADGKTWAVMDSSAGHWISSIAQITTIGANDSSRFVLSTQAAASGNVATAGAFSFTANPFFHPGGVTAQAVQAVNYIRFRLTMTAGDYAAAGATRGLSAKVTYPSVDANPNQPGRATQ